MKNRSTPTLINYSTQQAEHAATSLLQIANQLEFDAAKNQKRASELRWLAGELLREPSANQIQTTKTKPNKLPCSAADDIDLSFDDD